MIKIIDLIEYNYKKDTITLKCFANCLDAFIENKCNYSILINFMLADYINILSI